MIICIPMAGLGRRFQEFKELYQEPKPLVDVNGEPMVKRVIDNLRPRVPTQFIFIVNNEVNQQYGLTKLLHYWQPDSIVIEAGITEGAVSSALMASRYLNTSEDILITACDQLVGIDMNDFYYYCQTSVYDGVLLTYPSTSPSHSFVEAVDGRVVRTAEKEVISNHANVGIYWFRHGSDFVSAAAERVGRGAKDINNEYYICPVYNTLIEMGKVIGYYEISKEEAHLIGTPTLLQNYLNPSIINQEKALELASRWKIDWKPKYRKATCVDCGSEMTEMWHYWLQDGLYKKEIHFCKNCGQKWGLV